MRLVALLLLALAAVPARAQTADEVVRWSVAPTDVAPGARANMLVRGTIAPGWKLYALDSPPPTPPLKVTLAALTGITAGVPVHEAPPEVVYDSVLEAMTHVFHERVGVHVPIAVAADQAPGALSVPVEVTFTVCNARICLPPKRLPLTAAVQVVRAPASAPAAPAAVGPPAVPVDSAQAASAPDTAIAAVPAPVATPAPLVFTPTPGSEAATPGLSWSFLLLAIGAGLASLLAPCVFPMLPLTVSYFLRHAGSRGEAVRMAGLYALTIVGTFTGLGLLLALFVGAAGAVRLAANPGVNLFIGLVFVAFGLSLLGLFELRLPARLVNRVDAAGRTRTGGVGVVFMGLALTLVSFSCTVPFVGALLAAAAQGAWVRPLVGMLVFSATFALPFFAFALFPRALGRLPKSGAWLDVLRVTLGLVEIAAALKFLAQADLVWGLGILTRPVAIALTAVLLAVTGLYLLGLVRLPGADGQAVGPIRLLGAVGFLGAGLYLVPGLWGAPLGLFDAYLPPRTAADFSITSASSASGHDDGWHVGQAGMASAKAEASRTGRPIFVDFSGYTCTNCRYMEANVFTVPTVAEVLASRFVRVRVYTDDAAEGEALQRYQLQLTGTVALPTYAILAPDGAQLLSVESGTQSAQRFRAFLERAAPSTVAAL